MLRHVVLFQFAPKTTEDDIGRIFAGFDALVKKLPGVRGMTSGRNTSPEGLDRGFRHGFVMDFDSARARDAYLAHPEHAAFAENVVFPALAAGRDSVIVFDCELEEDAARRQPPPGSTAR